MEGVECPSCLGTGEIMQGKKKSKGFKYESCTLCKGNGTVPTEIAKDYIFSLNEDNFEIDEQYE